MRNTTARSTTVTVITAQLDNLVRAALTVDEPLEVEATLLIRSQRGVEQEFFRTMAEVINGRVDMRTLQDRDVDDLNRIGEGV